VASWLRQSKWRRTARRAQAEVRALRAETEALRQRLDSAERGGQPVGSLAYRRPPAALTTSLSGTGDKSSWPG
ncbi:MAG TPA: hypothetical protein VKB15_05380, partial [Xanthobacteraceae bacterium]|nr:hypothetical protein [Xanthobacteraceae bacterium]